MKKLIVSTFLGVLSFSGSAFGIAVTVNGSGCPISGDAQAYYDGDELVIPTGDMNVKKGNDIELSAKRKNCSLTLASEQNNKIAVRSVRVRGWTDLRSGDELKLTFDRFIQGEGKDYPISFSAKGPENQGFEFSYKLSPSEKVWSECNPTRALTLNTSLLLKGAEGQFAQAELDEIRVRLDLVKCP